MIEFDTLTFVDNIDVYNWSCFFQWYEIISWRELFKADLEENYSKQVLELMRNVLICLFSKKWRPNLIWFPSWPMLHHEFIAYINITSMQKTKYGQVCYLHSLSFDMICLVYTDFFYKMLKQKFIDSFIVLT